MVRVAARHDHDVALRVLGWPLREMLIAYLERTREQMAEVFRHRQILYQIATAFGGDKDGKKAPKPPPLLAREPDP